MGNMSNDEGLQAYNQTMSQVRPIVHALSHLLTQIHDRESCIDEIRDLLQQLFQQDEEEIKEAFERVEGEVVEAYHMGMGDEVQQAFKTALNEKALGKSVDVPQLADKMIDGVERAKEVKAFDDMLDAPMKAADDKAKEIGEAAIDAIKDVFDRER